MSKVKRDVIKTQLSSSTIILSFELVTNVIEVHPLYSISLSVTDLVIGGIILNNGFRC